jgi:hypothetical protein
VLPAGVAKGSLDVAFEVDPPLPLPLLVLPTEPSIDPIRLLSFSTVEAESEFDPPEAYCVPKAYGRSRSFSTVAALRRGWLREEPYSSSSESESEGGRESFEGESSIQPGMREVAVVRRLMVSVRG